MLFDRFFCYSEIKKVKPFIFSRKKNINYKNHFISERFLAIQQYFQLSRLIFQYFARYKITLYYKMQNIPSTDSQSLDIETKFRYKSLYPIFISAFIIGCLIVVGVYLNLYKKSTIQVVYDENSPVTVVFTSLGRYDLLQRSIDSFLQMNTYPVKQIIVVEDGDFNTWITKVLLKYPNLTWLILGTNRGQQSAIDFAYSLITTQFVFHTEDDWQFIRPGFIEANIKYMNQHKDVIQIYNRFVTQKYDPQTLIVSEDYLGSSYIGFSYNPGIKRMSDYKLLGPGGYKNISLTYQIDNRPSMGPQQKIAHYYADELHFKKAQSNIIYANHMGEQRRNW